MPPFKAQCWQLGYCFRTCKRASGGSGLVIVAAARSRGFVLKLYCENSWGWVCVVCACLLLTFVMVSSVLAESWPAFRVAAGRCKRLGESCAPGTAFPPRLQGMHPFLSDADRVGNITLNDLLTIHASSPSLFEVVELPRTRRGGTGGNPEHSLARRRTRPILDSRRRSNMRDRWDDRWVRHDKVVRAASLAVGRRLPNVASRARPAAAVAARGVLVWCTLFAFAVGQCGRVIKIARQAVVALLRVPARL